MKKIIALIVSLLMVVTFVPFSSFATDNEVNNEILGEDVQMNQESDNEAVNENSMSFTKSSYDIIAGDPSFTLYLTAESADAIEWETSDSSVVKITSSNTRTAMVSPVGGGNASVIARNAEGLEAICDINVSLPVISITPDRITIGVGNSYDLKLTEGKNVSWTTSNSDIAAVYLGNQNNTCTIKAMGLGTAVITATDKYGSTSQCQVNVVESYLELDKYSVSLAPNKTSDTISVISGKVSKVTSIDEDIASVSYYSNSNSIYISAGKKTGETSIEIEEQNGAIANISVSFKSPFELNNSHIEITDNYYDYFNLDEYYTEYDGDDEYIEYYPEYNTPSYGVRKNSDYYDGTIHYNTIYATKGNIKKVESLNTDIVKINSQWGIIPLGEGTATIECQDSYGQTATFTVTVPKSFVNDYIKYHSSFCGGNTEGELTNNTIFYGSSLIKVDAPKGSDVVITIDGRDYNAEVMEETEYYHEGDYYRISAPRLKVGQKINFKINYHGGEFSKTLKVKNEVEDGNIPVETYNYVYKSSKKIKIVAYYVKKGDTIQVKIGKKKYKKKVTKNAKRYVCTLKIKKSKAGTKIKMTILDSKNKTIASNTEKVYYAKKLKKGMKKKYCKLVPGWEDGPEDTSYYKGKLIWWYEDDSYLIFKKGKLVGWYY